MSRRAVLLLTLIILIGIMPVHRYYERGETPDGDVYYHVWPTAVLWGAGYTLGPDGVTFWRVVVPSCCMEWTPGQWLPTLWIDYCLFCGQPGNADQELMIWLRAPGRAVDGGFVWAGALVGWSSEDGWWDNARDSAHRPWGALP